MPYSRGSAGARGMAASSSREDFVTEDDAKPESGTVTMPTLPKVVTESPPLAEENTITKRVRVKAHVRSDGISVRAHSRRMPVRKANSEGAPAKPDLSSPSAEWTPSAGSLLGSRIRTSAKDEVTVAGDAEGVSGSVQFSRPANQELSVVVGDIGVTMHQPLAWVFVVIVASIVCFFVSRFDGFHFRLEFGGVKLD